MYLHCTDERIYWKSSSYKEYTVASAAFDGSDRRTLAHYHTHGPYNYGLAVLGEKVFVPTDTGNRYVTIIMYFLLTKIFF